MLVACAANYRIQRGQRDVGRSHVACKGGRLILTARRGEIKGSHDKNADIKADAHFSSMVFVSRRLL